MSESKVPPAWGLKDRADLRDAFDRVVGLGVHAGLDQGRAENCAGEALKRAWEHRDRFDPAKGTFRKWLLTIGRHAIFDELRRRRAEALMREAKEVVEHDQAPTSSGLVERRARYAKWRLFARLTAHEKEFLHVWIEQHAREMDARSAADQLGLTLPEYEAEKKRLQRRMKTLIKEMGVDVDEVAPLPEVMTVNAGEGEREDDDEMG